MTTSFVKPYKRPSDLIALLQSRGLLISDNQMAETILRTVGYYRFSAYLYPFITLPKENHVYKPNSKFEDAFSLYQFDHRLRLFLFDEIGKVEIGIRSAIANIAADCLNDKFWITNSATYANTIQSLSMRNYPRPWISSSINQLQVFYNICLIKWFLDIIVPDNNMKETLKKLLQEFPNVDIAAMGFPANWENEPLWR